MKTFTLDQLKEAVQNLKDGRELLEQPGVWIQGHLALGRHATPPLDIKDADRVCSFGALAKVRRMGRDYQQINGNNTPAAHFLACAINPRSISDINSTIVGFNDNRTKKLSDILAAWDKGIELAEGALKAVEGESRG